MPQVGRQHAGAPLLVPVFSHRKRVINWLGVAAWLSAFAWFWQWWLRPDHVAGPWLYAITTVAQAWITIVPAYFIVIFSNARIPPADNPVPEGARIAMVVTKAPSEPFSVVRRTLIGALSQGGILHDTWLADEDPDEETSAWCSANGVRISSRKGLADYHRPDWPRRTKSKEGNLTFFYDRYGYDNYDFVSQFDADHVPEPDYLRHAIAPFADPSVGYVSAPSICDSNAADSWAARARLYVEASLHGALQCGYNNGWAPLCIGSHYSVRTTALRQVGGLGPELAEDHSTTLILNAGGWNGVHAVDAIAHGAGPDTFADLVTQEFQWSRSLVAILLRYSPTYVPRLAGRKRFQFIFSQLWYPVFSGMMAIMYVMPIYALLSGNHLVNVTYVAYLVHILPLSATLIALAYWWRSTGLFRPRDARIVSPEGMAFIMLRWPWSLLGSIAAALDRLRGKVAPFKITHKGPRASARLPLRATQPYLLLSLIASIVAFAVDDPGTAGGFYLFNLVNAAVYGGLSVFVLIRHAHENGIAFFNFHLAGLVVGVSLSAVVALSLAAAYRNGPKGLYSMMVGIEDFHLTRTIYPIAGAGQGDPGKPIIRFSPGWGPR